jgi:hypothetical protein
MPQSLTAVCSTFWVNVSTRMSVTRSIIKATAFRI